MLRIPRFVDSLLKVGFEVVSVIRCPLFTFPLPKYFRLYIFARGRVNSCAIARLEGLCKLKKFSDLIGNRSRDVLDFIIMPQPTTLTRAHTLDGIFFLDNFVMFHVQTISTYTLNKQLWQIKVGGFSVTSWSKS
jgi:hypothetical protein